MLLLTLPQELTSLTQRTAKASCNLWWTTPSSNRSRHDWHRNDLQVTVAELSATLQGSNFKSRSRLSIPQCGEDPRQCFRDWLAQDQCSWFNPPSTSGLSNDTAIVNSGGMFSSNPPGATLSSVSQLDVLTVANAKKMLTAVDGALVRIDLERSDLGATMSRMEHVINNLSNISKNTKEARSRIQDADIALETTNLTKAQVLNQAAQAMLAQANRTSQSILSLLQN